MTGHLTSSGAASTPLTQRPTSLTCQSHLTHDYLRSLYVTNSLHRMLLLIDSACAFSSNEAALSSRLSCYLLSLCALQSPTVRIMSCITPLCDTTPVLFSDCVDGFLFLIRWPFTLIVVNPSDYTNSIDILWNVVPIKRIEMDWMSFHNKPRYTFTRYLKSTTNLLWFCQNQYFYKDCYLLRSTNLYYVDNKSWNSKLLLLRHYQRIIVVFNVFRLLNIK